MPVLYIGHKVLEGSSSLFEYIRHFLSHFRKGQLVECIAKG